MVESPPATVQLLLANGTATGLVIAQKLGATAQVLSFSRADYPTVRLRPEFTHTGAYVLLGSTQDGSRDSIYVGQTDDVRARLDQHSREKDFWTRAIVLTTTDQNLNRAHVLFLESKLIGLARDAKRVHLENGKSPDLPSLSEMDAAYVETCLRDFLLLLPLVSTMAFFPILEPARVTGGAGGETPLVFRRAGAEARGVETPDGFVVLKGSTARAEALPSAGPWLIGLRDRLVDEGVLTKTDTGDLKFAQDYRFDSPSAASGVIAGTNGNGRLDWKDHSGRTLKKLQEISISGE